MGFCHGNGDQARDGCCWVGGVICVNRWKIVDGRIKQGPDLLDRGTVEEYAARQSNSPKIQQAIIDQAQALTYACRIAVGVISADPRLVDDRVGFEAAWAAHVDYQPVADAWEAIGKPRSWCPEYGPAEGQCCYAEDETVNAERRASLSAAAVQIRQHRSA